jgi:oligopeptide transport system ATP-binding protein
MTVREIVGEGLRIHRLARGAELEERVRHELDRVGLDPSMLDRFPHEFSGGQRQRVAIARALAVDPSFVVCDEPVSALDVSVQAQIVNLLERIQSEAKVAYLFISHDLRLVEYLSHRIAVMYLGRVVETGPTAELSKQPLHPYTRALFDAAPRLPRDGEAPRKRLRLAGEPPSASAPPPGCGFAPRCPRAERGKCDTEVPPLAASAPGSSHQVACFFPG